MDLAMSINFYIAIAIELVASYTSNINDPAYRT